ncbi:protein farnesyltransferase subunit beta-like isoform X1 [Tachypleus tridentatus]|uniref:protein farnesyltransferase subunit beta-like isoform X1 n=1 Tax=Tachypleus tridentatus TaxID=6853 RepID=UPI003FD5BA7B
MGDSERHIVVKLRCLDSSISEEQFDDENFKTATSEDQVAVEETVKQQFEYIKNVAELDPDCPQLLREQHIHFLKKGLCSLPQAYECLDASRPWLCYWILHSLELLDEPISDETKSKVAAFLSQCQHPDGGFGGGPQQLPHLAPTYAAVNALCIIGTEEAYQVIDRTKLQKFLYAMRQTGGSFTVHESGEVDVRGVYCALAVARLTNIFTPDLFDGTAEWVVRCQTYEGGFVGVPGMEAHGGYTFCGFASLVLLGREKLCDVHKLLRWLARKQMKYEGGFQGRTNKLVDGCYSFWQGGTFPLIHRLLSSTDNLTTSMEHWLFNQTALQEYLLVCCQNTSGGLIDKPGKPRDFYHTCYTLSGLSIAQHFAGGRIGSICIVGDRDNEVVPTHPVYNITVEVAVNASEYFNQLPVPTTQH